LIFLIVIFIGLPLFTQTTNTSFSHIESRFASTFLENCLHSVHNSAPKRCAIDFRINFRMTVFERGGKNGVGINTGFFAGRGQ